MVTPFFVVSTITSFDLLSVRDKFPEIVLWYDLAHFVNSA